ncbi:paeninodin family lasso peptide [Virgibacillus sp. DJP39]
MKKEWKKPFLEELDVSLTMAGPGLRYPDEIQTDPDEDVHYS